MKYEGWKIGPRIQRLRKERNMTAEELGVELGVSTSHISQIEQGCRKMSVDLLYRLMEVLSVDANTLLAVSECACVGVEVSVDEELAELPKEQQVYFQSIFLQMIRKLPA